MSPLGKDIHSTAQMGSKQAQMGSKQPSFGPTEGINVTITISFFPLISFQPICTSSILEVGK